LLCCGYGESSLLRAEPFGVRRQASVRPEGRLICSAAISPDSYVPKVVTTRAWLWFQARESSHYRRAARDPAWVSICVRFCLLTSPCRQWTLGRRFFSPYLFSSTLGLCPHLVTRFLFRPSPCFFPSTLISHDLCSDLIPLRPFWVVLCFWPGVFFFAGLSLIV